MAVVQYDAGPEAGCRLSFFSVFDGHGGRHVAQYAAEHLNSAVLAAGLQAEAARLAVAAAAGSGEGGPPQPPQPGVKACKAAIVEGFRELDRRVLEQCSAGPGQPGWPDGSTAVAAWVLGDAVLVANVGDARCVLARRPQQAAGEQPAGGGEPQAGSAAQQAVAGAPAGEQAPAAKQAAGGQQQQQQLEPLKAITLTREHKAIFPQERQRIEKAGSFVSSDGRLAGALGLPGGGIGAACRSAGFCSRA